MVAASSQLESRTLECLYSSPQRPMFFGPRKRFVGAQRRPAERWRHRAWQHGMVAGASVYDGSRGKGRRAVTSVPLCTWWRVSALPG